MSDVTQDNFDRVLLLPCEPEGGSLALLRWSATGMAGRVVQVYVNGRLHDVTFDAEQREMWLHVDRTMDCRIELLAVPVHKANDDGSRHLRGWSPEFVTGASLTLLRDESLLVESRVIVTVDGEDDVGSALWPADVPRSGFGGLMGEARFGFDDATSPGLGLGEFGVGPFGTDGVAWRWFRDDLAPGVRTLQLRAEDADGRVIGRLAAPQVVTIDALPRAAAELALDRSSTLHWQ